MASTFEKLNLKDQKQIVVLNAPERFERELAGLRDVRVSRDLERANEIEFSLAFVTKQKEVEHAGQSHSEEGQRGCRGVVRLSQGNLKEVQKRDQPGSRLASSR